MLGARGATGADTSGGALALILRVGANTDDARRKMKALDDTVTKSARWQMKQFRTAFTTFFSVSAIRTLILQSLQYAKNFENVRDEVKALGIEFDESVINKLQVAEVEWRSFLHTLRIGIAGLVSELSDLNMGPLDAVGFVQGNLGAYWGARIAHYEANKWRFEKPTGSKGLRDELVGMKPGDMTFLERQRERNKVIKEAQEAGEIAQREVDAETQDKKDRAAILSKKEQRRIKLGKLTTGGGASSFQQASLVESKDALTKFGLFRGQHGQDVMLSVVKQQLSELVSIQLNTEPLKRGII